MRLLWLLLYTLLAPVAGVALYNGNPSLPMMPEEGAMTSRENWFGVKVGYEFNDVYDRKLHLEGRRLKDGSRHVQTFNSVGNFGVLTLNFFDRVEVFGLFGALSTAVGHHPYAGVKIAYRTENKFAAGVGGRAILAYWGDLQIGLNASWVTSTPPLSSLKVNGRAYSTRHADVDYTQWQVGAGISYKFGWFIPYVAVDFSEFRERIEHLDSIKFLIPGKHVTFKDNYPFGGVIGLSFVAYRAIQLSVEARFINENALSASADFKF